jgi:hypothetical protein
MLGSIKYWNGEITVKSNTNELKARMVNAIYSETAKGKIKWNPHLDNGQEYMVANTANVILKAVNTRANGDYPSPMRLYLKLQDNPAFEEYCTKDVVIRNKPLSEYCSSAG